MSIQNLYSWQYREVIGCYNKNLQIILTYIATVFASNVYITEKRDLTIWIELYLIGNIDGVLFSRTAQVGIACRKNIDRD